MPPHQSDPVSSLKLTAFKKYPTNYPHKNFGEWLQGKKIDDNVSPYWRVHNKLYDLQEFVERHPGGRMWIEVTQGTDITEAFESSHISEHAEKLLQKYYVKDISTPRNSPYTFHEDGFYKTFKRKVRPLLKKMGTGPSWKSVLIQDSLFLAFVVLTLACSLSSSYTLAVLAGFALNLVVICAHNYFHQKDNWRMYYFDLSCLSSYEWRVTHALSHHLYTNTANDIEISMLEPLWHFLPKPDKTIFQRYGSFFFELAIIPILSFLEYCKKIYAISQGSVAIRPEYFLSYSVFLVMAVTSPSLWLACKLFMTVQIAFSIAFISIGLTVAHHHPDIFHDGDRMREDTDWGLCQLDAVRDRKEVTGNLMLVLTTFGDHTLHHLLPTVDHAKLSSLYPAFLETCKEFNVPFSFVRWPTMIAGKYMQMANNTPNPNYPEYKIKAS